jgi:hypothetical protein
MTPAEVAAALVAHPRGPKPPIGDVLLIDEAPSGYPRIVDTRGLVWVQDGDGWALVLGHPATAGVLLVTLLEADPSIHVHRDGPADYIAHVAPGVCEHAGATAGEAVALALLAVWGPA